jgi:V8-like Glu-specific endopeptidase
MRYHLGVTRIPALLLAALLIGWPAGAGPERQKVFKPDDRFPVLDTSAWPWRAACRVYSIFPDDLAAVGSGIFVGPRHVLTAGHVVYDDLDGGLADFVEVAPGYDYGYEPYGYARAIDIRVFRGWEEDEDFDYDLALITLGRNLGNGWLEVASLPDEEILAGETTTAGYPSDVGGTEAMYAAVGPIDEVDEQTLYFAGQLDVYFGQSGSGLWMDDPEDPEGDPLVVGTISWSMSSTNGGPRITAEKAAYIASWIATGEDPANLAVTGVDTDLPDEVECGAAGTVAAAVSNLGGASASSLVEVVFTDAAGTESPVGSATVNLGAGDEHAYDLPFDVPADAAEGLGTLRAAVNTSGATPEWPRSDNEGTCSVVVLPEWRDVAMGERVLRPLTDRAVARYRFTVDAARTRLRLKVALKAGVAEVRRPGGSTFTFSKQWTENAPEPGTWEILIRNTSNRTLKSKFLAK